MRSAVDNILEELGGAWRHRWAALLVAWGFAVTLWLVIMLLPDSYQASARVFVDTRTPLGEVTRGIGVDTNVDTQIARMRQALLGGPELDRVARDLHLFPDATTPSERQPIINKFRQRIDIVGGVTPDHPAADVYVISYKDYDRARSLKVVDELVKTFVANSLSGKRAGSEQAQKFLADQIAEYEHRLSAAEERLAAFKKANVGLMPGAQGDYFHRLQAEMDALDQAQARLAAAVRRRDELQRQLRGEQPFLTTPGDAGRLPTAPVGTGGDTAARIQDAQARLDDLLLRFTDKHPDVIALRATLVELKERQQAEIAAARSGDPGAAARIGLNANPVFQNIQLQFNQAEVDIATITADVTDDKRRVSELKNLVGTAPQIEANFAQLNRDYDVTRAQYQALLERLERAHLSEEADTVGIVRFEVIDPPTASFAPVAPDRPLLICAALLLSLAAGAGTAYAMNRLRPVFLSAKLLNKVTGLPVLGIVSMTSLQAFRRRERHRTLAYAAVVMALVVATGAVLITQGSIAHLMQGLVT